MSILKSTDGVNLAVLGLFHFNSIQFLQCCNFGRIVQVNGLDETRSTIASNICKNQKNSANMLFARG